MIARNSENTHQFQAKLFKRLNAYSCQGLLLDNHHNFTAALEAVECSSGEEINNESIYNVFSADELHAKYILAKELHIPFYLLIYFDNMFKIFEITERNETIFFDTRNIFNESDFARWWGYLKQTTQVKGLNNGGEERIKRTNFDIVLRKYGYEWGGNIDGFMLTESKMHVKCIIDNISVRSGLENDEPGHYFLSNNPKHGPKYDGWYGSVKCSSLLKIPHLLFTIDKTNASKEHIGLTVISEMTPSGIKFKNNILAKNNIVFGIDNIVEQVHKSILSSFPPLFIDKYQNMVDAKNDKKLHTNSLKYGKINKGMFYHDITNEKCSYVKRNMEANNGIVLLDKSYLTEQDARDDGLSPCKFCFNNR